MRQLIGLSLEHCINDLIDKENPAPYSLDQIKFIISSHDHRENGWENIWEVYGFVYWDKNERAKEIFWALVAQNKIVESFIHKCPSPLNICGIWINDDATHYPCDELQPDDLCYVAVWPDEKVISMISLKILYERHQAYIESGESITSAA